MTSWPALPFDDWANTYDTVHMVVQILGKVRVALSPPEPEWAHITLFVSARGLTTGPVPSNVGLFDVEADFLDHEVVIRTAAGDSRTVPLRARPVAEFWSDFVGALRAVGVDVDLPSVPQEVPDPIPFPDDTVHSAYDPEAATRFWRVLTLVEPVFEAYRADFDGRVSRVQFFWGSADLAVTRFSGRPCAPESSAARSVSASELEQMNVGWWPGSASFPHAAFYAYAHPKPDGIEDATLDVPGASWNPDLGEFILHYDDVCSIDDPGARVREFLDAASAACSAEGQSSMP